MKIHSRIKETGSDICRLNVNHTVPGENAVFQNDIFVNMAEYGKAWGSQIFSAGLCILEINYQLIKKVTDSFIIDGDHIQLSLFFEGDSKILGMDTNMPFPLDAGLVRVNFQEHTDMDFTMLPQEHLRYITIIISRDYYLDLLKNESWAMSDVFHEDVVTRRYMHFNNGAFVISHQIQALLSQIFDQDHPGASGPYRTTFIEMKLREMFFLFHLQYREDGLVLHNFDTETLSALQKAKAVLASNPANPLTIRELSRYVSLNEQKLKQGFKALYGTTIYGYIFDTRMKEAGRLVHDPNYSINQVSSDLGYKSTSHFISAFKKYYGQTPRQASIQKLLLNREN